MDFKFTKPTIYMSHSIAGDNGDHLGNCQNAQAVQRKLEKIFPEVKWYCPGRVNLVIDILFEQGALNYDQIIKADLEILRHCHGWFWWYTSPSKGCTDEQFEAFRLGLTSTQGPYMTPFEIIKTDLLKANFSEIRRIFTPIVEKAKERFRNE